MNSSASQESFSCSNNITECCPLEKTQMHELDENTPRAMIIPPPISSNSQIEGVANRLGKLNFLSSSSLIEEEEDVSCKRDLLSNVEIPNIDFSDVKECINAHFSSLSQQENPSPNSSCKTFNLPLRSTPFAHAFSNSFASSSATQTAAAAFSHHREGRLYLQVQGLQMQPASQIPFPKGMKSAVLVMLVTLEAGNAAGNAVGFEAVSEPFPTTTAKQSLSQLPSEECGIQLFSQCTSEGELPVPGLDSDLLVVSVYCVDENAFSQTSSSSSPLSSSHSRSGGLKEKIRELLAGGKSKSSLRRKSLLSSSASSSSVIKPSSSTLSCVSSLAMMNSSNSGTANHATTCLIAQSQIPLSERRYEDIFRGKLIEMEIKFEGNLWVSSLKIGCCFLGNFDALGALSSSSFRLPKGLSQAVNFAEARSQASSVFQQGFLMVKSRAQPWWKQFFVLLQGPLLVFYDAATAPQCPREVVRICDLGQLAAISGYDCERTGQMPRSFRLWMRKSVVGEGGEAEWIDCVAPVKHEYNGWVSGLKRVMRGFSLCQ